MAPPWPASVPSPNRDRSVFAFEDGLSVGDKSLNPLLLQQTDPNIDEWD